MIQWGLKFPAGAKNVGPAWGHFLSITCWAFLGFGGPHDCTAYVFQIKHLQAKVSEHSLVQSLQGRIVAVCSFPFLKQIFCSCCCAFCASHVCVCFSSFFIVSFVFPLHAALLALIPRRALSLPCLFVLHSLCIPTVAMLAWIAAMEQTTLCLCALVQVLELLWDLAHLDTLPTEIVEQALKSHSSILVDSFSIKEQVRRHYALLCIDDIKKVSSMQELLSDVVQLVLVVTWNAPSSFSYFSMHGQQGQLFFLCSKLRVCWTTDFPCLAKPGAHNMFQLVESMPNQSRARCFPCALSQYLSPSEWGMCAWSACSCCFCCVVDRISEFWPSILNFPPFFCILCLQSVWVVPAFKQLIKILRAMGRPSYQKPEKVCWLDRRVGVHALGLVRFKYLIFLHQKYIHVYLSRKAEASVNHCLCCQPWWILSVHQWQDTGELLCFGTFDHTHETAVFSVMFSSVLFTSVAYYSWVAKATWPSEVDNFEHAKVWS